MENNHSDQVDYKALLLEAYKQLTTTRAELESYKKVAVEEIAIVGIGCRFPGAVKNTDDFWQLLTNGSDVAGDISSRWDKSAYYHEDPEVPGKMYTSKIGVIDEIETFDPRFFNIAPREAAAMDPQQRLLLTACWEALEDAFIIPEQLKKSKTGVFIGLSTDDYLKLNCKNELGLDPHHALGTARSIAAGRISYFFDFQGPAIQLDTACSSSLVAMHLASNSLRTKECDVALAGGINLILSPETQIALSKLKALSKDGKCHTFDADANGYLRSEGLGIVVLKRLSDAEKNKDRIYGVIKGSAINHDGESNGLTAPNGLSQARLYEQALHNARLQPESITYIEAHGTGTVLGDPIEIGSLSEVYCKNRTKENPLYVGSVKSNIGHTEAAAGMAGLLKALFVLNKELIPANHHLKTPNPFIDWDNSGIKIPTTLTPLVSTEQAIVGISAFGLSGTNAHLLIGLDKKISVQPPFFASDKKEYLLPISALTKDSLVLYLTKYKDFFSNHATVDLAAVCYTASVFKTNFRERLALVASSAEEFIDKITAAIESFPKPITEKKSVHLLIGNEDIDCEKIAALYTSHSLFQSEIDLCDKHIIQAFDCSIASVFTGVEPSDILPKSIFKYTVLFALSKYLERGNIKASAIHSYGIGEFVAAALSGIFSFEAGIQLLQNYSEADCMEASSGQFLRNSSSTNPVKFFLPIIKNFVNNDGIQDPNDLVDIDYWIKKSSSLQLATEHKINDFSGHFYLSIADSFFVEKTSVATIHRVESEETLLRSCEELFNTGHDINFKQLLNPVKPVTLPSYPFEKYFFEYRSQTAKKETNTSLQLKREAFPNGDIYYCGALNTTVFPYLNDHLVFGLPVLPAAAIVELILSNGRQELRKEKLAVHKLKIYSAIVLESSGEIKIVFSPSNDTWDVQFYYKTDTQEWTLKGVAQISDHAESSFSHRKQTPSFIPQSVEQLYDKYSQLGINYSNAFKSIRSLSSTSTEATGEIALPKNTSLEGYLVHPGLLDSCFQLLGILNVNSSAFLPAGIENATVSGPLGDRANCFCSIEKINNKTYRADLTIESLSTGHLLCIEGLLLVEANSNTFTKSSKQEDLEYELVWEKTDLSSSVDEEIKEKTFWLIFTDQSAQSLPFVEVLEKTNDKYILVKPADTFKKVSDQMYEVNMESFQDYKELLQHVFHELETETLHVVNLSGFSTPIDYDTIDIASLRKNQYLGYLNILFLLQSLKNTRTKANIRISALTKNAQFILPEDEVDPTFSTLWGQFRVLFNEFPEYYPVIADLSASTSLKEIEKTISLLKASTPTHQFGIRKGNTYVPRFILPAQNKIKNNTDQLNNISIRTTDFGLFENLTLLPITIDHPQTTEVQVEIYAAGLNFRDVLHALGKFENHEEYIGAQPHSIPFGLECSGKISAVGSDVTSFSIGQDVMVVLALGCFGSYVNVDQNLVVIKPSNLDYQQASTVPLAFLTAYYGLIEVAQLKKGERVLIHAGAGGVGHAAIQLAKMLGAEVYTTAHPDKWEYLKSLGVEHIFSSRDNSFEKSILQLTDQKGVDVVLNSLTGDILSSSINVIKHKGRFLEIGKIGILSKEEMFNRRSDIQYTSYDLNNVSREHPAQIKKLFSLIGELLENQHLSPLPLTLFPISQVHEAFRFMSLSKHKGKVVIEIKKPVQPILIQENASYLITGGTGAIGQQLAKTLVEKGARNIILLSRTRPNNMDMIIENIKDKQDINIQHLLVDISDKKALEIAFSSIKELKMLKGIFHTAGVLRDSLTLQQTEQEYFDVLESKLFGTVNLHQCCSSHKLDFFIGFSSISALLGNIGQSNYSAGNSFLDSFSFVQSKKMKLASSINWGPWLGEGMAKQYIANEDAAIKPIDPATYLEIVFDVLQNNRAINLAAFSANWISLNQQLRNNPLLLKFVKKDEPTTRSGLFIETLEKENPENRKFLLKEYLQQEIMKLLETKEPANENEDLMDIGMDSLVATELRSKLQKELRCNLSPSILLEYNTIHLLSDYLFELKTL